MEKIGIVGCGAFGYAIGLLLSRTHPSLEIWAYDIDKKVISELNETRKHPYFHKEEIAPDNLRFTLDSSECLDKADLVVFAVPGQYMRKTVASVKKDVPSSAIILNVSKALESETDKRMSEVISEELKGTHRIASLAGGMLAGDVASGNPVGADIGCPDEEALWKLEELFLPSTVHVDITTDIAAVEYGSSFKNVIAIGAGIIDGLEYGVSAKSFYIAQALREIERLAVILGTEDQSFHTSPNSWIGDIMTTCFGDSRNREFGELLGKGMTRDLAVAELEKKRRHAEGLPTLKVVKELMEEHSLDAPFITTLYDVVYEGKDAHESFKRIALFQYEA